MEPPGVLGHSNVPLTCITSTWSSYLSCNLFYLPSPRLRWLIGKRQLIPHLILNYWASSRLATPTPLHDVKYNGRDALLSF